jgi:glycosyltransferase involved in cell wall biosynthesis
MAFISDCIRSVINQTYSHWELIVIDDASHDDSVEKIRAVLPPHAQLIVHTKNVGMCKSFNEGLNLCKGKYVIDLAGDDILFANKLSQQVSFFERLNDDYGIVFSDAMLIDEQGKDIRTFYKRSIEGKTKQYVPSGNLFEMLLSQYIVLAPTMLIRKTVLDKLNGYDETLVYEDYDFMVRASRNWKFAYLDEITTGWRQVHTSASRQFYRLKNDYLVSTLKVQQKALLLTRTSAERRSLSKHIRYFIRQCFFMHHFELAFEFNQLLTEANEKTILSHRFINSLILWLCKRKVKTYYLYRFYLKMREK